MLKKERQAYILHQVNLHNKVLSSSLSADINVSEDTIRRDLQELADEGKVIKVHGGALSHSFSMVHFPPNEVYSQTQKRKIDHRHSLRFNHAYGFDLSAKTASKFGERFGSYVSGLGLRRKVKGLRLKV